MEQYTGATPANDGADGGRVARRPRTRGIRRLLTLPVAVASAMAVTLGIVQPAAAAPQTVKRQPKPKALPGAPAGAPRAAVEATLPAEVTVLEGDTVSTIAARHGLSTAEVLAENGLSWSSLIFPGQRLALPGGAAAASTAPAVPRPEIERHVVEAGDTVSGIAAAHGLEVDVVLSANGLSRASLIFPGQAIVLPGPGAGAAAAAPAPSAPIAPGAAPVPEALDAGPIAMLDVALDDEMRGNARIVVDVGRALGVPDRGIVIALAAAAQESGLRNVDRGDLDSLGLFQQRPSQGWGSPEQVLDPVRAAAAFYGGPDSPTVGTTPGLLDVEGWASLPLADAAQAVQHSGHPDRYAKWEAAAEGWLAELG